MYHVHLHSLPTGALLIVLKSPRNRATNSAVKFLEVSLVTDYDPGNGQTIVWLELVTVSNRVEAFSKTFFITLRQLSAAPFADSQFSQLWTFGKYVILILVQNETYSNFSNLERKDENHCLWIQFLQTESKYFIKTKWLEIRCFPDLFGVV